MGSNLLFSFLPPTAGGTVSIQSPTAADRAEGWKEDGDGPQIKDKAERKESPARVRCSEKMDCTDG